MSIRGRKFGQAAVYGTVLAVTTTFDPSNKGTSIALTNGNLTATESTASLGIARSVLSHASGLFYAEFTIVAASPVANVQIGIISGTGSLNTFLGPDQNSIGWAGSGTVTRNSGTVSTIQTYAVGNTVCMAVDLGNKTIWFRTNGGNWNNSGTANPATNTGGITTVALINSPFFAAIATGHSTDSITANFGGSAYAQSVPSGFGNW